ncbi:MAG: transglutaminase [Bacteroidetes bacterium RIFCSPLOWO2_12_FULL_31_6]|nr:MAG: transglutaminase [Bacteroidetes bacterium RIFCSPLOWO2_12_FULL_31_6]
MENYLTETAILNFTNTEIQTLVTKRGWNKLDTTPKILSIYNFVRDEIAFGYNAADNLSASVVLSDGIGQCNTKSTLFMALLRAVGVPCRFHGFAIDKKLQKGAISGIWYKLAPKEIIHSWVEVLYNGKWINMEGFILDMPYLHNLQQRFTCHTTHFVGYGVAIDNFKNPPVKWTGGDTYIQKEGIVKDFGLFDTPDQFYQKYGTNLSGFKNFVFQKVVRKKMNKNVASIRNNK